mgnify:CR=1 FL=1
MMKLVSRWTSLIRSHDGPLTRELERRPGRFGLGQLPSRLAPDATARTVCGFCSTGCGLLAHLREGEAMNLSPDPAYPVNRGTACPKGWEALSPLVAEDRATMPLIRDPDRNAFREASWDEAARAFVDGMRAVQDAHGPEAAAFLGTGQIPTEELVFLGSLAKFGMGMVDGDGNTRQCMATAAQAYKESFGFDAPPYCYADFENSDVIVLIGSNLCIAHPILWERIHRNPHHPEIIVVDPRRTETAIAGTQHLPIQPKSDLVLFYGLAHWLIAEGAVDQAFVDRHTEGFAAFRSFVEDYPIERVLAATGLTEETFLAFARSVRDGKRVSYWWTMGVNQSHEGVRLAQAIINLSLLTGQIGRPGTGPNSITGQCNAMGSRLFSNTSNLLGGREFENPGDRREVAAILGIPVDRIPTRSSRSYDGILDAVRAGEIKALWIVATNTAHSWIDSSVLAEIRDKLDFLVVQDMYTTTDTARLADLVLPAAGWGEKDGSFINSERRFGRVRKLRRAPGQALSDFQIFRLLAHHLDLDPTVAPLFAGWKDPEDVFSAIKEISRDRPCDISGIRDYRMLEQSGGIQWPFPAHAATEPIDSERRLFADGVFPREGGRALFVFEPPRPVAEPVDEAFPFVLMTGRGSSTQWHTETRTGRSGVLRSLDRQPTRLQMHPRDAARLGLSDGERVEVRSRRGTLQAILQATPTVLEGTLFVSMHDPGTNRLTFPDFDPYSRQPSYKHCAVSVSAASGGS